MISKPQDLKRYTAGERVNHWTVAICFVLLALSGLALFHPAFWSLTGLFGGGEWTRILHPYIGIILAAAFSSMFNQFRHLNRMTPADREWLRRSGELLSGNEHNMPDQDKYNAGQKVMFWSVAIGLLLMLITGLVIWRAWFNLPVVLVRFAVVIHAAVGAVMIAVIIGHVYLGIWTKGTVRAMLYGTVTRAWAKQHHAIWYRQMTGDQP
jgi:formate dehydrogenase subunit gamma